MTTRIHRFTKQALAIATLVITFLFAPTWARNDASPAAIPTVALATLPPEVNATLELIRRGGPFPYRRDGVEFQNRERRLPMKAARYYHEYTVPTPGSKDRGARRIVAGGAQEYYYTADHYRSFRRIQP